MNLPTFRRVAILGATGPTGFHLARVLRGDGVSVRLVSRNAKKLDAQFRDPACEKVTADLGRADDTRRVVEGCDLVFDCIGLGGGEMDQHAVTARNIAAATRAADAKCVQVSSYWAYLPAVRLPLDESHPRTGGGPWVRARRAAEDILLESGAAILHLPDFFGPAVHTSTLQQALAEAESGATMNWIGAADTVHEYAYVPDAMALAWKVARQPAAFGERWIVPGSGPIAGTQVAQIVSKSLGRQVRLRAAGPWMLRLVSLFNAPLRGFMQMVPDYLKPITYDASRLLALVGGHAATDYAQAIGETLRWLGAARQARR